MRPSWDYVGTMLGFVGSSWAYAYVGPSWDYVGRSWVLCWDILALCWPILGPCCAVVGLCRTKKGHQSAKKPVFHGICSVFTHSTFLGPPPSKQQKRQNLALVQVKRTFCSNLTPCNSAQRAAFTVIYNVFCTSSTPIWNPKICKPVRKKTESVPVCDMH